MQWIMVAAVVFMALLLLKTENITKRVKIFIVIMLGFILYLSVVGWFASDKLDLSSPQGVANAVYVYFGWIGQTASNLWDVGADTASMVGNAIKVNTTEEDRRR